MSIYIYVHTCYIHGTMLSSAHNGALYGVAGYTCAHLALQGGHLKILQLLLEKGANVNEPDGKSGRTLLHMAADLGYLEAIDLLLHQRDLNLNARTYGGLTAISLAHGRRLNNVVEWLYRVGADCTQLTEDAGESTDEEMVSGCELCSSRFVVLLMLINRLPNAGLISQCQTFEREWVKQRERERVCVCERERQTERELVFV